MSRSSHSDRSPVSALSPNLQCLRCTPISAVTLAGSNRNPTVPSLIKQQVATAARSHEHLPFNQPNFNLAMSQNPQSNLNPEPKPRNYFPESLVSASHHPSNLNEIANRSTILPKINRKGQNGPSLQAEIPPWKIVQVLSRPQKHGCRFHECVGSACISTP